MCYLMLTLWDALFGILGGGVWPRACNPNPISDQIVLIVQVLFHTSPLAW